MGRENKSVNNICLFGYIEVYRSQNETVSHYLFLSSYFPFFSPIYLHNFVLISFYCKYQTM